LTFIDYDGTVVASYSKADGLALTSLPANPSHTGLTAQGWNYTLAQIKTELNSNVGKCTVGQMYITDDAKTRIYIHLEKGRLHPYLGICPNGTVVVDWGDNSATSTLTGTSLTDTQYADHAYASDGDYTITIAVSSGGFAFYGNDNTSFILKKDISTTAYIHRVYTNAVQKIELGTGANINDYSFCNCHSLSSITIPSGVTKIGTYAFYTCYSLSSVTIPSGVTSTGGYAFNNCNSLLSVTIPSGVTSIETSAFQNCRSLTNITIPSGVTSIGTYAFNSCYLLKDVTIPSNVTSIGAYAFYYCYALSSITIPSGVTSIETYTFSNCHSLKDVTISSNVTSIGDYAFYYCLSLSSITIPSGVTKIGKYAFGSCCSFSSVTIPIKVTSIGIYAFTNCYGLSEIHFKPTTPPSTVSNSKVFNNIQSDCIIYVPAESLEAYQTATNWSTYASYMIGE
jgi:hypothetical protein